MSDDAKERVSRATDDDNSVKALQTGREALKRSKAIYEEKKILEEKLTALKLQSAYMRRQLEKTEERKTQLKVALDQVEKETQNYLAQADCIKRKREQLMAKYPRGDQYIKKLRDEIEICKRKLFSEKPIVGKRLPDYEENSITRSPGGNMAAAWQESQGRTATTVLKDNFEGENMTIKPERQCVMCLIEEASVLFLPCAHQVFCEGCNDLHKNGRNHCPSCNTQIQERIHARFEGY